MEGSNSLKLTFGTNLTLGSIWQQPADGSDSSTRNTDELHQGGKDSQLSRKRARDEASKESLCTKASREKMRRDRLNDRFLELGKELDPGLAPKTDKAVILNGAVKLLVRLRSEMLALSEGNQQLRDQIKELKAEKSELREEKARLKAERERVLSQIQTLPPPPAACFTSPAAYQVAAHAAYAQHTIMKPVVPMAAVAVPASDPSGQAAAMWQWLPAAAADTSRDHILRPPVA
eukprot:TRINITY_DN10842_c0_g1_i2.p1 TRINITY_DN10842_c0_g1~~TRINITY_DN10842_c0_g1_i2.p1  ORF type:complete len:233 (-),score=12.90 TRINITY_DN10842_c0_g1_i2:548-1246(-)